MANSHSLIGPLSRFGRASVGCLSALLLGSLSSAHAEVRYELYRGSLIQYMVGSPTSPNFVNGGNDFEANWKTYLGNLVTIANNPNNAAATGISADMNRVTSTYTLCDIGAYNSSGGALSAQSCLGQYQGYVGYTTVYFPVAGQYTLSVISNDAVQIDVASSSSGDYHNLDYKMLGQWRESAQVGDQDKFNITTTPNGASAAYMNINVTHPNTYLTFRVYWINWGNNAYLQLGIKPPGATSATPISDNALCDPAAPGSCGGTPMVNAVPDSGTTPVNTPITTKVISNDTTGVSAGLNPAVTIKSNPAHGSVTCDAAGSCTYTPTTDYTGTDTYTYQVCSNTDASNPTAICADTTVTITVLPDNRPVVSVSKLSQGGGGTFQFAATNLSSSIQDITTPASGQVTASASGPIKVTAANQDVTITEQNLPTGFTLTGATCFDANSAVTGKTGTVSTVNLANNTLTIPAANVVDKADIRCTFTNSAPNLNIIKSAPALFTVGTPGTYTLQVSNSGSLATSAAATITDTIPTGLTIGTLPAGCTNNGQNITCTVPAGLAVDGTATFTIPVTPTAAANKYVDNTAKVQGGGSSNCTTTPCSSNTTSTAVNASVLTLAKTAPQPFVVGQASIYRFTVTNNGTGSTTAPFTIYDSMPRYWTNQDNLTHYYFAVGTLPSGCNYYNSSNHDEGFSCTISTTIAPGASYTFDIPVTPQILPTETRTDGSRPTNNNVTNSANVVGGGDYTCSLPSPPTRCSSSVTTVLTKPVADLTISKSGPAYIRPSVAANTDTSAGPVTAASSSYATYTLKVNVANANVAGTTTVTDTLPGALQWVAGTSTGSGTPGTWTCSASGTAGSGSQLVTCTTPSTIAVGTPETITLSNLLVATGTAAGQTIVNNVKVANPNEASTSTGNNTASFTSKTVLTTLSKTVQNLDQTGSAAGTSATALPGQKLHYCLTAKNLGGADLNSYTIKDYVPGNTEFVANSLTLTVDSATATPAGSYDPSQTTIPNTTPATPASGLVTSSAFALPSSKTATFCFDATVK